MIESELLSSMRILITASVVAAAFAAHRALFRDQRVSRVAARRVATLFFGVLIAAAAFSHVEPLRPIILPVFPIGLVLGLALAVTSLALPAMRDAFDRLQDGDVRLLVGTRMAFGSMLFGLAAAKGIPESFAFSAGIGDIVVGCLAIGAPSTLDERGSRVVRAIVHGVGLTDMIGVVFMAITVVRPWALAHGNAAISMALPWLAVPLMVAVDLHGLRKVFRARVAEPIRDGSQSAGRVRSALSGA